MAQKLKILVVSPEVHPLAKTGGLGDVAGALPKALAAAGRDVRVIMPRYKKVKEWKNNLFDFPVDVYGYPETATIRETTLDKTNAIPVYLVDNYRYYDRDSLYGYDDDLQRFTFFAKAVMETLKRLNWKPDVVHCNDWQTALVNIYLKTTYANDAFFKGVGTVFTIHNMGYQGNFPKEAMKYASLPESLYTMDKLEFYGAFSLLKGAIVYSDIVNTVSKRYSEEIQTKEYGFQMEGLLKYYKNKVYGVMNGLDYQVWDPRVDNNIPKKYWVDTLSEKLENKLALQKEAGLKPDPNVPLFAITTRLSDQKGVNLLLEILPRILKKNMQLVLLGTGDKWYHDEIGKINNKYPNARFILKYDEGLSHRIYAGSDVFMVPSKYEPCGLTQLTSLRYGTLPLVRETGGLADSVKDLNKDQKAGNGFSFPNFKSTEYEDAIYRALKFYEDKKKWSTIQARAMQQDFSWDVAASSYMELYAKAVGQK